MSLELYKLKNMFVGKIVRVRFNDGRSADLVGTCTDIVSYPNGPITRFNIVFEGYLHIGFNAEIGGENFVEGDVCGFRQKLELHDGPLPEKVFVPAL